MGITRVGVWLNYILATAVCICFGIRLACAEVTLDGSFSHSGELNGPDVTIPATVGKTAGSNLFHSFGEFNIRSGESATFTGPATVENVLSRVTGGNPSEIDGPLRSTILDANLFFLNRAGVMFGPNASLDVQGSFHVSTADYLRLADGKLFDGTPSLKDALLTTAPPEAFGFLSENPNRISFHRSNIVVPEGKTLSIVGGGIDIAGSEKGFPPFDTFPIESELHAAGGRINIVSVNSQGEVVVSATDVEVDSFNQLGVISIDQGTLIDASSENGGDIYIRGGHIAVKNSSMKADTLGAGKAGLIDVEANQLDIHDSALSTSTIGTGDGGKISLDVAQTITISGKNRPLDTTGIFVQTKSSGNAGKVEIESGDLNVLNGAGINTTTFDRGAGGDIELRVKGNLRIFGDNKDGSGISGLILDSVMEEKDAGNAGALKIEAGQFEIGNGGFITASTSGSGKGGSTFIKVRGDLKLFGTSPGLGFPSVISTSTGGKSANAGNAGAIIIDVDGLDLRDGAIIFSTSSSPGDGGLIDIKANEISLSGANNLSGVSKISTDTQAIGNAGKGGDIKITATRVSAKNGGQINSGANSGQAGSISFVVEGNITFEGKNDSRGIIPSGTSTRTFGNGKGGTISVSAHRLNLIEGGRITAESFSEGDAGNIVLVLTKELSMVGGSIEASAINADGGNILIRITTDDSKVNLSESQITTRVGTGEGQGGIITVKHPSFLILYNSSVTANAFGGPGGDIRITTDHFIDNPGSIVDASSERSIDGNVVIDSPEEDIGVQIAEVYTDFIDAADVSLTPCAERSGKDSIELGIVKYEILPHSPYALFAHLPKKYFGVIPITQTIDVGRQGLGILKLSQWLEYPCLAISKEIKANKL